MSHQVRIDRAIGRIPSLGKRFIQPLGKTSCCSQAAGPHAAQPAGSATRDKARAASR